ncbi:M24 family metallopeptidase [Streptomyces sp. ok210]|jgi:Xaa-Pro aminopeptidase|uniref:M24 family metallopeptidase n=1 Tax=Streptomyces sp. ok210 TaxID=1761905 RepID=UPI0008F14D44|nr:M24 family metallopeptidase [Streptomyces sp. ok210]SFT31377.1 Metallopeptidase family M24 [Streptomyces sp. ok210]
MDDDEQQRAALLLEAQAKAEELFDEIERRQLIVAGKRERELSDEIRDLAYELFGIERFWHKRIVRAGPNTLHPYRANPPDRVIAEDDVLFCDFGPLLEQWEADVGRTYVLGDDPAKHRLRDDVSVVFDAGRRYFHDHPDITGAQLFTEVQRLAAGAGWEVGATHAGHLVGEFPHERINGDDIDYYITAGSDEPMRRPDRAGRLCHWILEIHLVDRARGFGGFHEQLLDLG